MQPTPPPPPPLIRFRLVFRRGVCGGGQTAADCPFPYLVPQAGRARIGWAGEIDRVVCAHSWFRLAPVAGA